MPYLNPHLQKLLPQTMTKIATETLLAVLVEEYGYDETKAAAIAASCVDKERSNAGDKEKSERKSPEYVIMVNDPYGNLPDDLTGWIVRKQDAILDTAHGTESEPHSWGNLELNSRIEEWGKQLSSAPKFKKWKFACLGDYVEYGNKKSAQQFGMKFVTKMPVYICPVNPNLAYWEEEGKKITSTINSLN